MTDQVIHAARALSADRAGSTATPDNPATDSTEHGQDGQDCGIAYACQRRAEVEVEVRIREAARQYMLTIEVIKRSRSERCDMRFTVR